MSQLTPFDELLTHQTVETFATVSQADRSWTERIWLTAYGIDGSAEIDCGIGKYPNRNIFDGFAGVSLGDVQINVRGSRELDRDPYGLKVGPIEYEVLEPLHAVRFKLAENEQGIAFDLTFTGVMPPSLGRRHLIRNRLRVDSDILRYTQYGRASGWLEIAGERRELTPDRWWCTRDHSWGLRIGVGNPEAGVQPPGRDPSRPKSFGLNWSMMQFEGYGIFHHLEWRNDGRITHWSGELQRTDGTRSDLDLVRSDLEFSPKGRRLLGGEVTLRRPDGGKVLVKVHPLTAAYHLTGGLYGGYRGNYHGTWRGPLVVEGERWDLTDPAIQREVQQLRDQVCRFEHDGNVGYGIFETLYLGDWPQYGFVGSGRFLAG